MSKTLFTTTLAAAFAILVAATPARAHEPRTGPHGGALVDAGAHHVELLSDGSLLTLFISDAADKPVAAAGFKASAVLVIDGKAQRVDFTPQGDRLTATAPGAPLRPNGAVMLTGPDGKTAQAKVK